MKILHSIKEHMLHPRYFISFFANRGFFNFLPDEKYLKLIYRLNTGEKLDLNSPQKFNEKLQWLKLYDHNFLYTTLVDKYKVKEYLKGIIGEKYIIPTLGVYEKFDQIDFESLPDQFVIKCTHDSGGLVICKDKSKFNLDMAKRKINKCLKKNFYLKFREWPYKNVKPRIIIEKYLDNNDKDLLDYKFFCFNGKVKIVLVCSNRFQNLEKTWFDEKFNLLPITEGNHMINKNLKKPKNYTQMISLAEKISFGISFVRVDFYSVNNNVFFGEMTFFPSGGFEHFKPESWNKILGDYIDLSNVERNNL